MNNNRNPLSEYKNLKQKYRAFVGDKNAGMFAHNSDGTIVPLKALRADDVEFIGGLWRVQNKNNYNVRKIGDRDIIIGDEIPYFGPSFFDYYRASYLTYNCYGPLMPNYNLVVAKYDCGDEEFWAYAKNITMATAYLGMHLYDKYKSLINNHAHTMAKKSNQK